MKKNKELNLRDKIDVDEVAEIMRQMPDEERMQVICIIKGFEIARQSKKVLAEGA